LCRLSLLRKTPLLCLLPARFLFKDQFIELSTNVPEDADLYGLGEVTIPTGLRLPRDNRIITLYNADTSALVPYHNLYGSHPFLLQVNKGEQLE
jgi:alpha-glucosidase (family GH31 glycosyl hydrolase)